MIIRAGFLAAGLVLCGHYAADPPADRLTRYEFTETHMGSPFQLVLYCADEPTARRASRAAFERIAALDAAFSDYQPESELMRLCDRAGGPPVAVSRDLYRILEKSLAVSAASGGAFDVTVGPVVRLWRRARRDGKMPDPATLAKARALVDYKLIELDPSARTVRLLKPGMKLDLGGIAKGYASDAAIETLRAQGIDRALVAGAGDVVASGPPPGRDGWTVGIAPLLAPESAPERSVSLRDAAVTTSGDAERFVLIGGRRYSHIVDPRTGIGVVDRSSVTVLAPAGETADALATAVYAMGPDRGLRLIEKTEGASALVVRRTEKGEEATFSKRFPALLEPAPRPSALPPPR